MNKKLTLIQVEFTLNLKTINNLFTFSLIKRNNKKF